MAVPSVGNPAGFACLQIFTKNSSGYATGQAGTAPAAGTTSHAYVTTLVSTANFSPRAQTVVPFEGGNVEVGQIAFGTTLLQAFDVVADAEDATIITLAQGGNIDATTVSGWKMYSSNPRKVTLPDVGLILTQAFQSRETATEGQTFYRNVIIPQANVRAQLGGFGYQAKSQMTLNVTPTVASKFPNGVAFGTNQGWQDNKTDHLVMITENPIALSMFVGDGSDTTYVLGYRPVSTVVTVSTSPNWTSKNGVATAATSIVTTTGVVTLAAAGTSGDFHHAIYETQFTAI